MIVSTTKKCDDKKSNNTNKNIESSAYKSQVDSKVSINPIKDSINSNITQNLDSKTSQDIINNAKITESNKTQDSKKITESNQEQDSKKITGSHKTQDCKNSLDSKEFTESKTQDSIKNLDSKTSQNAAKIDNKKEQLVLKSSMYCALMLAILGIGFGVITKSSALLFDGIISLVSVALGALSVVTSRYIYREDDDVFQYGYVRFEPMVNLFKSLILLIVCAYAFISGLRDVLHGGYALDLGGAVAYSMCAFVLCFGVFAYTRHFSRTLDSELIRTDMTEWRIDCVMYFGSIVAFLSVFLFDKQQSHAFNRYIDCGLLVVLSVFISVAPLKIFIANLKDLMMVAPPQLDSKITEIMESLSAAYGFKNYDTHVAKNGRFFMIEVNILTLGSSQISVAQIDSIRDYIMQNLNMPSYKIWLSVSLTANPKWL